MGVLNEKRCKKKHNKKGEFRDKWVYYGIKKRENQNH